MKHVSLAILYMLTFTLCTAQIRMSYSMGCIGGARQGITASSNSVFIDSKTCFQLSNGVQVFNKKKNGLFLSSCEIRGQAAAVITKRLNLIAYPNPVASVVTIRTREFIQDDKPVILLVFSMTGTQVRSLNSTTHTLNNGVLINMNGLSSGMYTVKVATARVGSELNIIKID